MLNTLHSGKDKDLCILAPVDYLLRQKTQVDLELQLAVVVNNMCVRHRKPLAWLQLSSKACFKDRKAMPGHKHKPPSWRV